MVERKPSTLVVPNPKTGRDVTVIFKFDGTADGAQWWDVTAYDPAETRSSAPRGLIAASQLVFDTLSDKGSEHGTMMDPMAFVMRGGAGLCLYMASALFAQQRGRRGIQSSSCLSHESTRLWELMAGHGLAERRGLKRFWLHADDVKRWIKTYRAKQQG